VEVDLEPLCRGSVSQQNLRFLAERDTPASTSVFVISLS